MYSKSTVGIKRKVEDDNSSHDSSSDSENEIIQRTFMEPEIDCEEWDKNCTIVKLHSKSNIMGFHLMPTCSPEPKIVDTTLPLLKTSLNEYLLKNFKTEWNLDKAVNNEILEIITTPWKVCLIKELLEDTAILENIRQEYYELIWNRSRTDLYEFHQSSDIQYSRSHNIKLMYNFLKNLMPLIGESLNVELTHISATCTFYSDTDYLLVHDDKEDDRVVAFILYLSDICNWEQSWGGALQLLNCDDNYQPKSVVRNIYPKNNQLILFPVSTISYHQVEEVTTKNFSRFSINGWFHGKVVPTAITPVCPAATGLHADLYFSAKINDIDLKEFINPLYLVPEHIEHIQKHIERVSEVSLSKFFEEEFFTKISKAFTANDLRWRYVGPPNRNSYEVLDERGKPEVLDELMDIFQSEIFFKLLESYTELEFSGKQAGMKYELQRWSPGSYSLLSDHEWTGKYELDVILYFECRDIVGGQTLYLAPEERIQEALITLQHKNNTLNLVYRDSARVNCYVSKYTPSPFYILVCSYSENKM